jgi:hypothetical protein
LGFNLPISSIRGNEHILCSHFYSLIAVAPCTDPQLTDGERQQTIYGRRNECSCTSSLPGDDARVFGMELRTEHLVDVFLELLLRDVHLLAARNVSQKHNDDAEAPDACC